MLQLAVPSLQRIPATRHAVRAALGHELDDRDVETIEVVVGELLGAAYESQGEVPLTVSIHLFPRLLNVRVRGAVGFALQDDAFHLRERVLQELTLAYGQRRNADGTTDLWAEVPRTRSNA